VDVPGHDACRLLQRENGWRLEGTAVYRHETATACLGYRLDCDVDWLSRDGVVSGWLNDRPVEFEIACSRAGEWTLNGREVAQVRGSRDLDFGFTPATNLTQIRRIALAEGHGADVPAAWLDVEKGTLDRLAQRYERRGRRCYWYEAPRFEYRAELDVNEVGFVTTYPALWVVEP
jgi:uncharacterized protein